jgi:hypothetical protein
MTKWARRRIADEVYPPKPWRRWRGFSLHFVFASVLQRGNLAVGEKEWGLITYF